MKVNNKADHALLLKAAELGILRSLQDYLPEPLKPGRLKRLFMEVTLIVDFQLKTLYANNPNFFVDNRTECAVYLEKFGIIIGIGNAQKEEIHVALMIAFCLFFLKDTKTKYPGTLNGCLVDILDYYERGGVQNFSVLWKDKSFTEEWVNLSNG